LMRRACGGSSGPRVASEWHGKKDERIRLLRKRFTIGELPATRRDSGLT
jgi:hypothetical protein